MQNPKSKPEDRKPDKPLSDALTGHPDSGGLAGQGGMTDVDDEDQDEDEPDDSEDGS